MLFPSAGQPIFPVAYEKVECDYVQWKFFRLDPSAKRWNKVKWIAFGDLLTRTDLEKQFGKEMGGEVKLDWTPSDSEAKDDEIYKRALVWTIWNREDKKVYVVTSGYDKAPLKVMDDPLKLSNFFPISKPVYSISTTD